MHKRLMRVLNSIITLVLLVGLILGAGRFLNPAWTDDAMHAVKAFREIPEESVEVISFGSSHVFKGLDPLVMYDEYGVGIYNYSCNWQHINTSLLFAQDAFRTQSPKVILVDTYQVNSLLQDTDLNGEIYYTKAIPTFDEKWTYLKQCFGSQKKRWASYFFPLMVFHSNWSQITSENFGATHSVDYYVSHMGYEPSNVVENATIGDYRTFEQKELSEDALAVLDQFVELCREHGTELVFYTVPYEGEYNYSDAMQKYCEENDCTYLDLFQLNGEVGLDGATDFRDFEHLNDAGAAKVAGYLGKYLTEHYELTDMRTIANNMWEL